MSSMDITGHTTIVNGHIVPLFSQDDNDRPKNAAHTEWILVRFNEVISYSISEKFRRERRLEIHERLAEDNVYLCKYTPDDLSPIIIDDKITHMALYPVSAVPFAGLISALIPSDVASSDAENKISLVVALHPNPSETPQQVLQDLETRFEAEHLDHKVDSVVNLVRVRLDSKHIQAIAEIDSVRSIEKALRSEFTSIKADVVLGTNTPTIPFLWTGQGMTVHVADSGFDRGSATDVHPAFTGRVLAVRTASNAPSFNTFDENGHGTHVAGSVLGDLAQPSGINTKVYIMGTAPKASLISIAINPEIPALDLSTEVTAPFQKPSIHTNSWGPQVTHRQHPYGAADARLVDQAMSDNPQLRILFAAGNDGTLLTLPSGRQQQVREELPYSPSLKERSRKSLRPRKL